MVSSNCWICKGCGTEMLKRTKQRHKRSCVRYQNVKSGNAKPLEINDSTVTRSVIANAKAAIEYRQKIRQSSDTASIFVQMQDIQQKNALLLSPNVRKRGESKGVKKQKPKT